MAIPSKSELSKKAATERVSAIVIFVDIRGFTVWSERTEVSAHLKSFLNDFYSLISKIFPKMYIKFLGDGAMIVSNAPYISMENMEIELANLLDKYLEKIFSFNEMFEKLISDFSTLYGCSGDPKNEGGLLSLGWGVTRGTIQGIKHKNRDDYVGGNINKASKLCGLARPCGIVIDKNDFKLVSEKTKPKLYEWEVNTGSVLGSVNIWSSKEVNINETPREFHKPILEVHVSGLCIRENNGTVEILLARRNKDRQLYSGLFEASCGGQLNAHEKLITGVARHFRTEMKVDVNVQEDIHLLYTTSHANTPLIPGVMFLCIHRAGEPVASEHSEFKWVLEKELDSISEEDLTSDMKIRCAKLLEIMRRRET